MFACALLLLPLTASVAFGVTMPQRSLPTRASRDVEPRSRNHSPTRTTRSSKAAQPYLSVVEAPALHFAVIAPLPPEPPERLPKTPREEPPPTPVVEPVAPPPVPTPEPEPVTVAPPEPSPPTESKPVSILPDDTHREIRAEDVLPYFSFPEKGGAAANIVVPFTPAQPRGPALPASSATYEQK